MRSAKTIGMLMVIAAAVSAAPRFARAQEKPTESEHRSGPHGLEGWTLSWPDPDDPNQLLPTTLVIARNGRVSRRINGDGMVWQWMFWADGAQVAYESGPKHFSLLCVLFDLNKGREVSSFDCYHDLPENAPDWARALEAAPREVTQ